MLARRQGGQGQAVSSEPNRQYHQALSANRKLVAEIDRLKAEVERLQAQLAAKEGRGDA